MIPNPHAITHLLHAWNSGDPAAFDELIPLVYREMRIIARSYISREKGVLTLQPTELVHEAYCRLASQRHPSLKDRKHFYGVAAKIMRRLLMDLARERSAVKHGGALVRVTLSEVNEVRIERDIDFLALDQALACLEKLDPRQVQIVELRFFAELSIEETAEALSVSPATVKRDWESAKAFLLYKLRSGREGC